MKTYERFLVDMARPGVALVTMNRPEKLNAMDQLFFRELIEVNRDLASNPEVGAIVLTGAGRAFSAGGDISTFPALTKDMELARDHLELVFASFHSFEKSPRPVIAAINGIAHGGGTEILGGVDYRIASTNANFAFREAAHGLIPGFGVVKFQQLIGHAMTMRLVGTAEIVDAQMALQMGIVQEVVSPETLLDRAFDLAEAFTKVPKSAIHSLKQVLNRDSARDIAIAVESTAVPFSMPETQKRVNEFLTRKN